MKLNDLTSAAAVQAALDEFSTIGQDSFATVEFSAQSAG